METNTRYKLGVINYVWQSLCCSQKGAKNVIYVFFCSWNKMIKRNLKHIYILSLSQNTKKQSYESFTINNKCKKQTLLCLKKDFSFYFQSFLLNLKSNPSLPDTYLKNCDKIFNVLVSKMYMINPSTIQWLEILVFNFFLIFVLR